MAAPVTVIFRVSERALDLNQECRSVSVIGRWECRTCLPLIAGIAGPFLGRVHGRRHSVTLRNDRLGLWLPKVAVRVYKVWRRRNGDFGGYGADRCGARSFRRLRPSRPGCFSTKDNLTCISSLSVSLKVLHAKVNKAQLLRLKSYEIQASHYTFSFPGPTKSKVQVYHADPSQMEEYSRGRDLATLLASRFSRGRSSLHLWRRASTTRAPRQ